MAARARLIAATDLRAGLRAHHRADAGRHRRARARSRRAGRRIARNTCALIPGARARRARAHRTSRHRSRGPDAFAAHRPRLRRAGIAMPLREIRRPRRTARGAARRADAAGTRRRRRPARDGPRRRRARGRGVRASASEYGGTMHTKVVYQAAKALSRIGCAVLRFNFRGVGASAGAFTTGEARWTTSAPPLDFMAERVSRARRCGPPACRSDRGSRSTVGAERSARVDAHRHRAAGHAATTSSAVARSAKPKFFIHGELDEICSAEGHARVLRAARRSRRNSSSSTAPIICSTARSARSADAIEDLLGDDWSDDRGAVRRGHRFRRSHRRRQGAERHAARYAAGRAGRGRDRRSAAPRAGPRPGRDRRRDPRLRDAGGRTGPERRAHRQPARRHSGDGVGGHGQPVLLVGPAGDRLRRRAHHVRLRRRRSSPAAPSR